MRLSRIASLLVMTLALPLPVFAANRAFVSGTGMDTGACPITTPCRSFAYALTQITSGGEIIAIDTAGYGSPTISFAASIIAAPGVTAFATALSGSVITVAAGIGDVVTLRGITVSGNGGTNGISFNSGQSLNLESCMINGHSIGVVFNRTGDTSKPNLELIHCIVANNNVGLDVSNAGPFPEGHGHLRPLSASLPPQVYATLKDSAFLSNVVGTYVRDDSSVAAADCVFSGNSTYGVAAYGSDGHRSITVLERCSITRNGTGIVTGDASGSQVIHAFVLLAHCQITGNDIGIVTTTNGQSLSQISNSTVNNTISGNGIDNSTTGTYPAQ